MHAREILGEEKQATHKCPTALPCVWLFLLLPVWINGRNGLVKFQGENLRTHLNPQIFMFFIISLAVLSSLQNQIPILTFYFPYVLLGLVTFHWALQPSYFLTQYSNSTDFILNQYTEPSFPLACGIQVYSHVFSTVLPMLFSMHWASCRILP